MRVLAMALVTIAAASISPAQAQTYDPRYPVCLQIYQGWNDYYFECGYTSLAQCQMSASGRSAQCIVNPYSPGPNGRVRRQPRGYWPALCGRRRRSYLAKLIGSRCSRPSEGGSPATVRHTK